MSLQTFFDNFALIADAPNCVSKSRELILQLAVEGKLLSQDSNDEAAHILLDRIKAQQQQLVKEGAMKRIDVRPLVAVDAFPFILPDGWKWIRLGSISQKLGAGSTPLGGKTVYQDNGVKFLRSQNVWNDGLRLDTVAHISERIHREMNGTQVEYGDILLNITGASIGRSSIVPDGLGEANVSQHVSIVRLIDKQLRFFVHLCLISPYVQASIMRTQVGISREGLSMRSLKEFVLPIPPLEEQKRIVAKVDELIRLCDDLEVRQQAKRESRVRLNNAMLAPLHNAASLTAEEFEKATMRLADNFATVYDSVETVGKLRSTILQLAVQGKLVPQVQDREPATVLLKSIATKKAQLIKDKVISATKPLASISEDERPFDIPSNWVWARLGNAATLIQIGPFGSLLHKSDYVKNGTPLVNPSHIKNERIVASNDLTIDLRKKARLSNYIMQSGDIVMGRRGEMGKCAIVSKNEDGWLCGTGSLFLRFTDDFFHPYLLKVLTSDYVKSCLLEGSVGTTMNNLNQRILNNLLIPVPPLEEQNLIVAKVNQLLTLCEELEAKLHQAEADGEKLMSAAVRHLRDTISNKEETEREVASAQLRAARRSSKTSDRRNLRVSTCQAPRSD